MQHKLSGYNVHTVKGGGGARVGVLSSPSFCDGRESHTLHPVLENLIRNVFDTVIN